jgi:predicted metal-binding protein
MEESMTAALGAAAQTQLLICVKCRRGQEAPEDERRPGQALFDRIAELDLPEGVQVTPVECLQNCDHGCTVALRGGDDRWTYVFANVDETAHPEMILDGAARYHATNDGLIPWRERPEHFKRNSVARIPPMNMPVENTND